MKHKFKPMIVSSIAALTVFLNFNPITSSAATVGDVIAYAYQVGMPEDMIQQYIAMGSGREWTSEQCDQAISALSAWAAERDSAINIAREDVAGDLQIFIYIRIIQRG